MLTNLGDHVQSEQWLAAEPANFQFIQIFAASINQGFNAGHDRARHFLVFERLVAVRAAKVASFGGQYDEVEVVRAEMPELFRLRDHRNTQTSFKITPALSRNESATCVSGRRQWRPWVHSLLEPHLWAGLHAWEPGSWRRSSD